MMEDATYIEQLGVALCWQRGSGILMLAGYFDESIYPQRAPKLVTIAGAICPLDRWAHLEAEWRQMLRGERLKEIHVTDLARARRGSPYANKKVWPVERRDALLKRCIRIGHDCIPQRFYLGTTLLVPRTPNGVRFNRTYFHCFQQLMDSFVRRINEYPNTTGPIALVFARNPAVPAQRLARYMAVWQAAHPRCGSFIVSSPRELPQLQFADMVAFIGGELFRQGQAAPAFYRDLFPVMNFEPFSFGISDVGAGAVS